MLHRLPLNLTDPTTTTLPTLHLLRPNRTHRHPHIASGFPPPQKPTHRLRLLLRRGNLACQVAVHVAAEGVLLAGEAVDEGDAVGVLLE